MSTDSQCIHVFKGKVFIYLKRGKEKLASALTTKELEQKIEKEFNGVYEYLVALDIFKRKNPNLS